MTGLATSEQLINQQAGQYAVALRDAFKNIVSFNDWVNASGGQAFLIGLGFSSGEAATIVSTYGNLAALAAIYVGGTPGGALNYQQNSNILWGGL